MCAGITRNPMRLTGTITALSAVARSLHRPIDVMRAFKPGCSFVLQPGSPQPD
jgi:hypothetical protein